MTTLFLATTGGHLAELHRWRTTFHPGHFPLDDEVWGHKLPAD